MTTEVGIDQARPILGDLVQLAEAGEDVIITRRGRPSAVITRIPQMDDRESVGPEEGGTP